LAKKSTEKAKSTNHFNERQQRIYDFLKKHSVAVLSTASNSGQPHGVVIYYDIDKDFDITFITKTNTLKHQNLMENNRLMLTVFESRSQTVCQISGSSRDIKNTEQTQAITESILRKSLALSGPGEIPISKINSGEYVAIRVLPTKIKFSVYARPKPVSNDEIFDSLGWYELDGKSLS